MSQDQSNLADHVLNVILVVVLLYVVTLPGSPLRVRFDEWRMKSRLAAAAEENWEALESTPARMDTSAGRSPLLIEFGDYECPFCRQSHPVLEQAMQADPTLTVGFRHFPLVDIHPSAAGAARAAICAEFQDAFRPMHSLLLESEDWQELPDWTALAAAARVPDMTEFARCLESEEVDERLEQDRELASELGVTSTPTFFYRYGAHLGFVNEEQLAELLAER